MLLIFRHAHRALMRVSWKELDDTGGRRRIAHDFMSGLHGNSLIVTIGARMVVGPGDRSGVWIIRHMPGGVGFGMFGVKKVGRANAPECAQRSAQVLVIARSQDAAAPLAKAGDALAIGHA